MRRGSALTLRTRCQRRCSHRLIRPRARPGSSVAYWTASRRHHGTADGGALFSGPRHALRLARHGIQTPAFSVIAQCRHDHGSDELYVCTTPHYLVSSVDYALRGQVRRDRGHRISACGLTSMFDEIPKFDLAMKPAAATPRRLARPLFTARTSDARRRCCACCACSIHPRLQFSRRSSSARSCNGC